jgi:hypothetical protein
MMMMMSMFVVRMYGACLPLVQYGCMLPVLNQCQSCIRGLIVALLCCRHLCFGVTDWKLLAPAAPTVAHNRCSVYAFDCTVGLPTSPCLLNPNQAQVVNHKW